MKYPFTIILTLMTFKAAFSVKCKENDCFCPNGDAVPKTSLCDGKVDCGDKFDEADEICKFKCNDTANTTVSRMRFGLPAQVCDGTKDCPNGYDELNCDVTEQYTCGNGKLVSKDQICDGINDCLDGLDEIGCVKGYPITTTAKPTPKCTKLILKPDLAVIQYTEVDGDQVGGNATIQCSDTIIGKFACTEDGWKEICETGSSCWSYLSDVSKGYYKAYPNSSNFDNAKAKCKDNCGQLVTVHSKNEADHIVKVFNASMPVTVVGMWIGMTRGAGGGKQNSATLKWIDGTTVLYKGPFANDEPNCAGCADCNCIDCMEMLMVNYIGWGVIGELNDIPCGTTGTRGATCAFYVQGV